MGLPQHGKFVQRPLTCGSCDPHRHRFSALGQALDAASPDRGDGPLALCIGVLDASLFERLFGALDVVHGTETDQPQGLKLDRAQLLTGSRQRSTGLPGLLDVVLGLGDGSRSACLCEGSGILPSAKQANKTVQTLGHRRSPAFWMSPANCSHAAPAGMDSAAVCRRNASMSSRSAKAVSASGLVPLT